MSAGESPARRGSSSDATAPVGETERKEPTKATIPLEPRVGEWIRGPRIVLPDPALVTRAVEQANVAAETAMRAKNRSVEFGFDMESGRVTMLIREELNGSEVTVKSLLTRSCRWSSVYRVSRKGKICCPGLSSVWMGENHVYPSEISRRGHTSILYPHHPSEHA